MRLNLLRRLNEVTGANISADKIEKRPTIHLRLLRDYTVMKQFLGTLDWIGEEIRAS